MKQVNLKSERVADLLEQTIALTGESKVDAVAEALKLRLSTLARNNAYKNTLEWLEQEVWAHLPEPYLGQAPSKEEQEKLLGF
jgi:hypothetical protein